MDRVILFLPANLFHSNVTDVARAEYLTGYSALHTMLLSAGLPISVSFQGIDLALLGFDESDFDLSSVELIAAPWAHFLPSLVGEDKVLGASAKWQIAHGVASASAARFNPEFDVPPQKHLLPHAGQIMPCVAPSTVMCSECDVSDSNGEHALMKREAVAFNGNVLVPLSGLDKVNGAWFTFPALPHGREPDSGHRSLAGAPLGNTGKVYVWYVDLEGTDRGQSLRVRPVGATVRGDRELRRRRAVHQLRGNGPALPQQGGETGFNSIARELGNKWTRWPQQIALYNRWGHLPMPKNDFDQAVLSLVTVSDVLSAMNSKIGGNIVKEAMLADGSTGQVVIGYDQTIISISMRMLELYTDRSKSYQERIIGAMRDLQSTDARQPTTAAGQFFASRIADMLERLAS